MEIRIRNTGEVVTECEFRRLHQNTSLPALTPELLEALGADPVLHGPDAQNLLWWQHSQRDGVEQINGKWYTKYIAGPVFDADADRDAYIAQKTTERNQALQASIVSQTQARLDTFAKTRNYAGILSLCTYSGSLVPKFAAEGQYGVQLRDDTWSTCYQILADVEAGIRPLPSGYEEIAPELPTPQWPA